MEVRAEHENLARKVARRSRQFPAQRFKVTNGAAGQHGITAVAPGSADYRGGAWAVNLVTFKAGVTPYLLTSAGAVEMAVTAGDVTVTRDPAADFRCPVQP